jgi:hypothetical protein
MTEHEWLTDDADWGRHLQFVEPQLGARRSRLLAVAFCHTRLPDFDDTGFRAALKTISRYADGDATRDELEAARVWARTEAVKANDKSFTARGDFAWAVGFAAQTPVSPSRIGTVIDRGTDGPALLGLLRDVVGNPFRPVVFDPSWRTETVLALARQMYESREFSAMPILADALMDAGCDADDVLNHCRDSFLHVRGCWVLDGVLGRA